MNFMGMGLQSVGMVLKLMGMGKFLWGWADVHYRVTV